MAVTLLAGPFAFTSNDVGDVPSAMSYNIWYPNIGFMVCLTLSEEPPSHTYSIFCNSALDGVFGEIMTDTFSPDCIGYDLVNNVVLFFKLYTEYSMAQEAFVVITVDILPEFSNIPFSSVLGSTYVKLINRRVGTTATGSSGLIAYALDGSTTSSESSTGLAAISTVSPGRDGNELFLGDATHGTFQFYNWVSKTLVSPVFYLGVVVDSINYAPEYNIVLTVTSLEVSVWSLEVNPSVMTTPVVLTGTLKQGKIVTYQIQVLGANSDVAAGELIDWSLSGIGILLDTQTTTDSSGYATARVLYDLTSTGASTITASLTY